MNLFSTGRKFLNPDTWGCYRVIPKAFEFWQELSSRLRDRILFIKSKSSRVENDFTHTGENGWVYQLLAP